MKRRISAWLATVSGLVSATMISGCSFMVHQPVKLTLDQRFESVADASAPVAEPVSVRWNEHAVPYIQAQNNQDLAFTVGMVHAHLRLGQMTVMKMIAQGRLSEMAGPIPQLVTVDHGLRMLDLCESGERSLAVMSTTGKDWISHYTRGINWYIQRMDLATSEHKALNIELEPMTERDVMCIARLVSADLTWPLYLKFLKLAEQPGWETAFDHMTQKHQIDSSSYTADRGALDADPAALLSQLFLQFSKSGSNSLAIHQSRSDTGSALMANDPHVGLILPNFWLLMGLQSPDTQVVGLTIPGVPVVGIGRNPNIAWGGTNMRAISSHLVDVSSLPDSDIQSRTETIKRRGWWSTERTVRTTRYGPILTDLAVFDQASQPYTAALDWVGHDGSDEITAFLDASRADNWTEFKEAFEPYQVSAFNMLYADVSGNIGMVSAYGQPVLSDTRKTLDLIKTPSNPRVGVRSPLEQTAPFNPDAGFLASANNKPFAQPDIPYAYAFANNDRYDRLATLATSDTAITVEQLKQWQRDTYSAGGDALRQLLAKRLPLDAVRDKEDLYADLLSWDGHYRSDSRGAVAFQGLMAQAWKSYTEQSAFSPLMSDYLQRSENWKPELTQWLTALPGDALTEHMNRWLTAAAKKIWKKSVWGDIQRQPQNPALGMVPYLGHRYRLPAYPAEGANDTLNKSVHTLGTQKQSVSYGSSARHISDLSSPDANYFVLHGGQDGWLMTPAMNDQTTLWRQGEYIQMPLSQEGIASGFQRFVTHLTPE